MNIVSLSFCISVCRTVNSRSRLFHFLFVFQCVGHQFQMKIISLSFCISVYRTSILDEDYFTFFLYFSVQDINSRCRLFHFLFVFQCIGCQFQMKIVSLSFCISVCRTSILDADCFTFFLYFSVQDCQFQMKIVSLSFCISVCRTSILDADCFTFFLYFSVQDVNSR